LFFSENRKCKCCEQLIPEENSIRPILSKYHFCSNIKDLSSSAGVGIFLYFYFLKFCIWALIISCILSSAPFIYFSHNTHKELISFCESSSEYGYLPVCKERILNSTSWLMYVSSENFIIYKNITDEIFIKNSTTSDNYPPSNLIDYNLITLITEIVLLFVYLIFYNNIINLSGEIDIINLTPSDYTLMISEFDGVPQSKGLKNDLIEYLSTVKY